MAGAFAALSLLLAAVGVYSIAAHVAAQRRYELGVRLALGATARQLVTLVVGQALRPVLVGALLGVGAAFASGRLLDSLLFKIGPADPGSFGTATVLLLAIALLASDVPAPGERFEVRATSARRIPAGPDIFTVPIPSPEQHRLAGP